MKTKSKKETAPSDWDWRKITELEQRVQRLENQREMARQWAKSMLPVDENIQQMKKLFGL